MPLPFVHLHTHTQYSLLDGACRLGELVEQAAAFGMESLAVTDHGNLYGAVKFYKEALKKGVRPVLGCEAYVALGSRFDTDTPGPNGKRSYSHLILLCENQEGYKNLCALVTAAFLEGYQYKPRMDKALLKEHSRGLIALSACLGGEVAQKLRRGQAQPALDSALEYRDIFGPENYYLELQDHGIPDQKGVNEGIREIHRETGIPLVATNDVHFLRREDFAAHGVLLCIQTKTTREDRARSGKMAYTAEHFFKSAAEMWERFGDCPEALENTEKIARRCHFTFEKDARHYPHFTVPEGDTPESYFRKVAREGFQSRLGKGLLRQAGAHPVEEYEDRLERELDLIQKMGFSGYFLVVWDFVRFAKEHSIPVGPGRGSAAGSFVSYCMGITDIDPLKYDLLFERFLNPERVNMPDIDIDFCFRDRSRVIEYVTEKYRRENVAQIVTLGELKARSALRDVGRALGVPLDKVDKTAKMIPEDLGTNLETALTLSKLLKEAYDGDPQVHEMLDIARRLEGLNRHSSIHAAGVVIAPRAITEFCPLQKGGGDNEIVTQFGKDDIESLGLLKMDFLGLKTLTIIRDALDLIARSGAQPPVLEEIPLDDGATFELFGKGATDGVFQFESGGMKDILRRLQPKRLEDLIVLNALYRPGPLDAGMIGDYIARARKKKSADPPVPEVGSILEDSLGIIVYQEQVMLIAQRLGGFTLGQADSLRKAMGKKDSGTIQGMRKLFMDGCAKRGIDLPKAEALFDNMETFGRYGFNKSHSAAYALLAYQTAYLKAHFPAAFMAATLSVLAGDTDEVLKYMNSCREMGITLLPPDVNRSGEGFTLEGGGIRYGLSAIKNVGIPSVHVIMEARRRVGAFRDLFHFCEEVDRGHLNKRVLENLAQSGAFDCFGKPRWDLVASLDAAAAGGARIQGDRARGQAGLFGDSPEEALDPARYCEGEVWNDRERFAREKLSLGFYLSGHPLMELQPVLRRYATHTLEELQHLVEPADVTVGGVVAVWHQRKSKKGDMYGILTLEDLEGRVEVLLFKEAYQENVGKVAKDAPVLVVGKAMLERAQDQGKDRVKVMASALFHLKDADQNLPHRATGVLLRVPEDLCEPDFLEDLGRTLRSHRGQVPVLMDVVHDNRDTARLLLSSSYKVSADEGFLTDIEPILGKDRVRFLFKTGSGAREAKA